MKKAIDILTTTKGVCFEIVNIERTGMSIYVSYVGLDNKEHRAKTYANDLGQYINTPYGRAYHLY